jgi:tRNA isopentenyl-2-thiomethyl-A-37 hydroxylase MiaE
MLFPISSEESLVESVALIVRAHLQARTAERLPELAPDLAYLLLMPYKGLEEARSWVERATPIRSG